METSYETLSNRKSGFNRRSLVDVQNRINEIEAEMEVTTDIEELEQELYELNCEKREKDFWIRKTMSIANNEQPACNTYQPTAQEEKAILAFNKNPQFTITE